jgi:hypothetical protein
MLNKLELVDVKPGKLIEGKLTLRDKLGENVDDHRIPIVVFRGATRTSSRSKPASCRETTHWMSAQRGSLGRRLA